MKMDVQKGWYWEWILATIFLSSLTLTTGFCPPLCSCDDGNLLTDCHEARNLKMVPIFLNPQTKFLSLAQNQIKEISMSLQFYSELQLLDFSQNQIESLGRSNFENLRNLKVLNISYNSIRILERGAFSGLLKTLVLDLSANQIEVIDLNALKGLVGLRELHLDRNRLDALNWDLFSELVSLERLTIRFNFIRILQPPMSYNSFLPNNSQTGVRVGRSEKLLSLTSAPQTVGPNGSFFIPWTLEKVVEVDLSWNQLAAVRNYGLSPLLPSLRFLNLCCNYIHTVEENAFETFPSLTLSRNQSAKSSGLASVNLSQNRLTTIPSEALEKVGSSLVDLNLSANRISDDLPPNAFRSLFQLQNLRISENLGIRRIDPNALLDNVHLVLLEANHLVNLTEFPLGIYNNKPYLETMSIQFAQITSLPDELFTNPIYNSRIPTLDLFGNPIDCNCSVWRLFEYVVAEEHLPPLDPLATQSQRQEQRVKEKEDTDNGKRKVPLGSIQCVSPPELQQFKIRDLSQSDFTHCFARLSFPHEHFELLVILLASFIVCLILTAVGVKLCCAYGLCPNQKRPKGLDSSDPGKRKENTGTTLDEFCSNVGFGSVCGQASVSTSTSGGKVISNSMNGHYRDFNPPIPPSPALSSKSKNKGGTLPNGSNGPYADELNNGYRYGPPSSYPHFPRTTTLGPRIPVPFNYEDDEDLCSHYTTINDHPPHPTLNYSNKLRFNPKMQLVLENEPDEDTRKNSQAHGHAPPPLILHYEYEFPEQRRPHASRVKQVPSVLV